MKMNTNIEVFFSNFSFLILFFSMIFYWVETSNYKSNREKILLNNGKNFNVSFPLNGASTSRWLSNFLVPEQAERLEVEGTSPKNIGFILICIANFCLFSLLIMRWFKGGHFPLSNLYESLMFLSWSLTIIHLLIEKIFFSTLFNSIRKDGNLFLSDNTIIKKLIGSIIAPCALFTNAFATFSLPKEMQTLNPLVPALQSNWLMMHVTVMILSYAALILGSLLSIGFLVLTAEGAPFDVFSFFSIRTKKESEKGDLEDLTLISGDFSPFVAVPLGVFPSPIGDEEREHLDQNNKIKKKISLKQNLLIFSIT